MSDYESMKSLAHASSSYHQAYSKAQENILHHVTINTLHEVGIGLLDPWSALHAPRLRVTVPNRVKTINAFLDRYGQGGMDDNVRLPLEDSLNILSLHRKFRHLIAEFCEANLARNPLYTSNSTQIGPRYQGFLLPAPSRPELRRLHRAFWRWELYSKLFGDTAGVLGRPDISLAGGQTQESHDEPDIAREFLGLFPIHEIEELACLHSHAKQKFEDHVVLGHSDSMVTFGPAFMYSIMTAPSEQVMHDIRCSRPHLSLPTMRDTLHAYEWIVSGGQGWPRKAIEDSLRLDSVPTDGWSWASLRGAQNTDYKLRRWGYVFWDRPRLDQWGVNQQRLLHWPWPRQRRDGSV